MRNKSNKKKSTIDKKKLSIKQSEKDEKRKRHTLNINPKKVICDDSDDEEVEEIKIINNKRGKIKSYRYPKDEDDISFCSFSTNKTEEIQKSKSLAKIPKKYSPDNHSDSSKSKSKYPKTIKKSENKYKKNKSNKKNENKSRKKNVIKSRNNIENNNNNNINFHIAFKNPYYKEQVNKYKDESSITDDDDSKDSDYIEEKEIKKKKKRGKNKKNNKQKEDIEMKDYSCSKYENQSKSSILGVEYLPCREKEQKIIYDYIQEGLQTNGNYNSLYIAGMPGTGKTASVKTVINILESEYAQKNKNNYKKNSKNKYFIPFTKLFLCGTDFPVISNIYKAIYKFIFSSKKVPNNKKCTSLLNKFFSNRLNYDIAYLNDPSNSHIILVIDEIDFLINKNQNILYNIFNWTTYEEAKLIVISISNTLDLPNKLIPKIKSRMGNNKIMFKPYNKDELITIIKSKGVEFEKFTDDAIKLSCMKVAAINGDLRRIIQILTRTKEIYNLDVKKNKNKKIDKNYILRACEDLFNSKLTKVIISLQISEKIIICAILSRIKDINDNKIKVSDLFDKKDIFIDKYNESKESNRNKLYISWEEYKKIIYNLIRIQLIGFCEKNTNNFIDNSINIKFYTDEFVNACNEDMELKPVLDYLTTLISI